MLHNAQAYVARLPSHIQTSHQSTTHLLEHEHTGSVAVANTLHNGTLPHARDPSLTRNQPPITTSTSYNVAREPRAGSAQGQYPQESYNPGESGLRRQLSNSYGHHRQTSVIHGMHHSRNTSFNSPQTSSPLSPESLLHASTHSRTLPNARRVPTSATETPPNMVGLQSPTSGHTQKTSLDSSLEGSIVTDGSTRRRGPLRRRVNGQSLSSVQPLEPRTPAEYALHHLFHSFVVRADAKINQCLSNADIVATPVEQSCAAGVDASFDQLITSLGHITRQNPKPLVDSLMLWRKAKGDAASNLKRQLRSRPNGMNLPPSLPRRHTEPGQQGLDNDPNSDDATHQNDPLQQEFSLADRRATVSVYILCRVLIAIFEQGSLVAITPDLAHKLEDIVFCQLRDMDAGQLLDSSLKLANWRIFGQVLGCMSRLDFESVTQRFVQQLDYWQGNVTRSTGTLAARDLESRIELLLLAMRNLHIPTNSEYARKTSEFLTVLGNLFADAHGPRIKQAYCQLLERLLIPVAASPESFTNVVFTDFVATVNSRLGNMLSKVRHWNSGFPLSILLTCISSTDSFMSQWPALVTSLAAKLRDRATRAASMQALCQLTWTYLARVNDSTQARSRRVDEIIKVAFPMAKKSHITTEPGMSDALVQLIRILGYAFQDLCFRSIVFPLANLDLVQSARDLRIEHMEPEKIAVSIRGFVAIMADSENNNVIRPSFPVFSYIAYPVEGVPISPLSTKPEFFLDASRRPFMASPVPSSSPVNISSLNENTRKYYFQFCEIVGKITIVCDNTFGGQASLNEKFSVLTPKTPISEAFSLSRREEGAVDLKQPYLELLHVAIQALPRCFSDHTPLNTLINLLCTGSAHVEPVIAASAASSLKAIAKQGYAQSVAMAFPRFIFSYDQQYSTMSDEGRLGPAHIESTLALYLELLNIWMEQVKQKSRDSAAGPARAMEMTNLLPLVDEIEAYGFFFLSSQSRRVRSYAIRVLRLVLQFDAALAKEEQTRIINILEKFSSQILAIPEDTLSVAERSRLQKDKHQRAGQNILIELCGSEVTYDSTLWFKAFPNLVRHIFEHCPHAIALSRGFVCDRLMLMQSDIEAIAKTSPNGNAMQDIRPQGRSSNTPADVLIDQWKLYLTMACVTLSSSGAQSQSQLANANAAHGRKTSRGAGVAQEKLGSARALFSAVIPMLAVGPEAIRTSVVMALGSINRKLSRTLLESLQYAVITCNDEAKARINAHHRSPSSPQRSQMTERLRTEVTHVYKLTASFLRHEDVYNDDWILHNLVTYAKDLRIYLSDTDIQNDWRFQKLRLHYCGLVEETFEGTRRSRNPSRWMPFEARKSAFALMEDWCGFSPDPMPRTGILDQVGHGSNREQFERSNPNAALEKEKSSLRVAALAAMATLCAGPVSVKTETNAILSFNLPRMLLWIDAIFDTQNDKMHSLGRRALKLLLTHNPEHSMIIEHAIESCYRTENQKSLSSYFEVVAEVLIESPQYPVEFWRVLGTVVFALGSESRELRMKSARLLRTLDERQPTSSNLQEFDISISDKTRAVYKLAQFEYSRRLASAHPHLAFLIFSEFSLHYKSARTDHQRNIVAAILPWLQTLELQVDPHVGGPTAVSYMLLVNMFEITICSSNAMHNEVQALWQALATGPHAGNVQLILDFIIYICLERREQNFVEYGKQIVVYLSTTPAGSRVLDFFLLHLTPKNMVNDKKRTDNIVPDTAHLPYVADLEAMLPTGAKQSGLSLGQVSVIFLVDLMVPPVKLNREQAIRVLHAVFVLWDHYTPTVQEQAREMLVHQLHELVVTKTDAATLAPVRDQIEQLVDSVRKNEPQISWSYEAFTGKVDVDEGGSRVPAPMQYLAKRAVEMFSLTYESFSDFWAKEALHWASICPVRHLACRSFQVFRCISVTLDSRMLADMLARLSNTIADEHSDYQTFSLEILTTLKVIIAALEPSHLLRYPQLFWTTCACLSTIHEREFFETLGMLDKLLEKVNLVDPTATEVILKAQPTKWEGTFEGLQALLYKGVKSADSFSRTLTLLSKLADLEDCELVGHEERFLYSVLANFPLMLHDFDPDVINNEARDSAQQLAGIAQNKGLDAIYAPLSRFAAKQYQQAQPFLDDIVNAIAASYFAKHDAESLIFMIGLLTNRTPWVRVKVMDILCLLIPLVDMKDSAITTHGPDLISPLLRLLQTEHSQQALQVMDHIMEVSGNPMEKHHLRMSMASGSARAIRKEYEATKSLYGIPQSSGWSIPMPAVYSSMTRNNVHAVFYTCGDSADMKDKEDKTPDVEFHQDEEYTDSYFPATRGDTMRSMETATDVNVSDLVNTLDSLDDFFDDLESDSVNTPTGTSHSSFVPVDMHEHNAEVYDEQTAPILHRSLNRAPSSASLHNGLADTGMSGGHYRGQPSLSSFAGSLQTSFSSIDEISGYDGPGPSLPTSTTKKPQPPPLNMIPTRPELHARSITSPANQFPATQPTASTMLPSLTSPIEYDDAVVSDSENSPFPPLSATMSNTPRFGGSGSTPTGHTPTSATENSGTGFVRRGMRRLTGGKSESAREKGQVKDSTRLRALSGGTKDGSLGSAQSPRVPRVPLEYLSANATAGGGTATSPAGSPGLED